MRDRPPDYLLLLDYLRSRIRAKHLSLRTEQAYTSSVSRFTQAPTVRPTNSACNSMTSRLSC